MKQPAAPSALPPRLPLTAASSAARRRRWRRSPSDARRRRRRYGRRGRCRASRRRSGCGAPRKRRAATPSPAPVARDSAGAEPGAAPAGPRLIAAGDPAANGGRREIASAPPRSPTGKTSSPGSGRGRSGAARCAPGRRAPMADHLAARPAGRIDAIHLLGYWRIGQRRARHGALSSASLPSLPRGAGGDRFAPDGERRRPALRLVISPRAPAACGSSANWRSSPGRRRGLDRCHRRGAARRKLALEAPVR